jgi:DNA-binding HxlR family transcriptional regulator
VFTQLHQWERTEQALSLVSGRWPLIVLAALSDGPRRFSELLHEIDYQLSSVALGRALEQLEDAKLITRHVITTTPKAVQYQQTTAGTDLTTTLNTAIQTWLHQHEHHINLAAAHRTRRHPRRRT